MDTQVVIYSDYTVNDQVLMSEGQLIPHGTRRIDGINSLKMEAVGYRGVMQIRPGELCLPFHDFHVRCADWR